MSLPTTNVSLRPHGNYKYLPPFDALRCFIIVAHVGKMVDAADLLCITPSAVTQQLNKLENFLGIKLFKRKPDIILNNAGKNYLHVVELAISKINEATYELLKHNSIPSNIVGVSMPASLIHRFFYLLQKFRAAYQNIRIDLKIYNSDRERKIQQNDDTIYIQLLEKNYYPHTNTEFLSKLKLVVVASKQYLDYHMLHPSKINVIYNIDEEVDYLSIWQSNTTDIVDDFFSAKDTTYIPYPSMYLAIEAAIASEGVLLCSLSAVKNLLNSGVLIQINHRVIDYGTNYYLYVKEEVMDTHQVKIIKEWLTKYLASEVVIGQLANES